MRERNSISVEDVRTSKRTKRKTNKRERKRERERERERREREERERDLKDPNYWRPTVKIVQLKKTHTSQGVAKRQQLSLSQL